MNTEKDVEFEGGQIGFSGSENQLKTFVHKKNKIGFSRFTGEVVTIERGSQTNVHVKGGTNFGYGVVTPVKIDTSLTTHNNFWLKTETGVHQFFSVKGAGILIQPGDRITMILAATKDNNIYVALINHTYGKHWLLDETVSVSERFDLFKDGRVLLATIFFCFCIFVSGTSLIYLFTEHFRVPNYGPAYVLPPIYFVYRTVVHFYRKNKGINELDNHIRDVINEALFAFALTDRAA